MDRMVCGIVDSYESYELLFGIRISDDFEGYSRSFFSKEKILHLVVVKTLKSPYT